MLARRKMSLSELAEKVDISIVNLSILKTGKAKAAFLDFRGNLPCVRVSAWRYFGICPRRIGSFGRRKSLFPKIYVIFQPYFATNSVNKVESSASYILKV